MLVRTVYLESVQSQQGLGDFGRALGHIQVAKPRQRRAAWGELPQGCAPAQHEAVKLGQGTKPLREICQALASEQLHVLQRGEPAEASGEGRQGAVAKRPAWGEWVVGG